MHLCSDYEVNDAIVNLYLIRSFGGPFEHEQLFHRQDFESVEKARDMKKQAAPIAENKITRSSGHSWTKSLRSQPLFHQY